MLSAAPLEGLPEVVPGDDLATLIASALDANPGRVALSDEHVLVLAHKIVSKSEGRMRSLADVEPGERALELAEQVGKDPRHVQVILEESSEVIRATHGVLICVTHRGFVCANAGVDASNVPGEDTLVLLPIDPDASARAVRRRIRELTGRAPAVVITDSFGRAWRIGQCDVAIGCAGIEPVEDWRGRADAQGRELKATVIAIADQLAATADLARAKDLSQPVVVVSGAGRHVTEADGPGAQALIRAKSQDLFR